MITENEKPDVTFTGANGNVFNLMGIASRALEENGMKEEAEKMLMKINTKAKSYKEAKRIMGQYVNIY